MTKHTPGPWHISEEGAWGICVKGGKDGRSYVSFKLKEGNASLIAAAPELLEALKTATLWCPRGWSLELDQAMTAARKAIAKAEGAQ